MNLLQQPPPLPLLANKTNELEWHNKAMKCLVEAVQELSLARSLEKIMAIVRRKARELTGADGASFVLRDDGKCYYADEDAISPLWKGQRFPMTSCISGWAMLNRQAAIIPDIYADRRIPHDAYRPTFVKSLVMVPIRTAQPIGAIGNYWARQHQATPAEVELLQNLANTTAVAMENVELYQKLEQRVRDRTKSLEAANRELEAFSYSVSHDLRSPLNIIGGYAQLLRDTLDTGLDDKSKSYFDNITAETRRMTGLVEDLLRLSQLSMAALNIEMLNLSELAAQITNRLQTNNTSRHVDFRIQENLEASADTGMMHIVFENLLSNAWKYSSKRADAFIEFGSSAQPGGETVFFVRDNGAGFDMQQSEKLFTPFKRLHKDSEFSGTGIGLATVRRIIERHGGRIWAEAEPEKGATFYFTLPKNPPSQVL